MYNFLKNIFGFPPNDEQKPWTDGEPPNNFNDNFNMRKNYENNDVDEHLDMNSEVRINTFGFPIFSSPMEIHKYFDNLIDEMQKKFEMFGFHSGGSITWEDGSGSFSSPFSNDESQRNSESLRDSFLKNPGYIKDYNGKKEDINLDLQLNADEVENLLKNEPNTSYDQPLTPKVYSKSVFIRTIRRPDGTVETVKRVRDNSGNEETTQEITQNDPNDPNSPPQGGSQLMPSDDIPGISILKIFFPF